MPHLSVNKAKDLIPSEVDSSLGRFGNNGLAAEEQNDTRSYQNRGKSPKIQFFGGQTVGLALGAVVHLILPQLLLAGEGSQTAVQVDGLCLGSAALFNTFMFFHNLKGRENFLWLGNVTHTTQRRALLTVSHK